MDLERCFPPPAAGMEREVPAGHTRRCGIPAPLRGFPETSRENSAVRPPRHPHPRGVPSSGTPKPAGPVPAPPSPGTPVPAPQSRRSHPLRVELIPGNPPFVWIRGYPAGSRGGGWGG